MANFVERNWVVIGISGVTCGGKTGLADHLCSSFPGSIILHQDEYFLDKDNENHVIIPKLQHYNWEIISSLNYEGFFDKVKTVLLSEPSSKPGLLIVEGHLVLNYPPIVKLLNFKYFITLTKEQCVSRRRVRVYDPPDPPGYFEECVWPMYLQHKEEMEKCVNDIS